MSTDRLATAARQIWVVLGCLALFCGAILVPLAEGAGVQARSRATIDMPTDTKDQPVQGLMLGDRQQESVAEITAIRLKSLPEEGVDPAKVIWVVTMSNTRPITQVVNLKISLRDKDGKRLASGRGRLSVATGSKGKELKVKMKVAAAAWQAGHKVELQADWIG
jgi:hypothetical protein